MLFSVALEISIYLNMRDKVELFLRLKQSE